jgi:hypothetical protein
MSDIEYVALNAQSTGRRAHADKDAGGGIDLWAKDLLKSDRDKPNETAEDNNYEA